MARSSNLGLGTLPFKECNAGSNPVRATNNGELHMSKLRIITSVLLAGSLAACSHAPSSLETISSTKQLTQAQIDGAPNICVIDRSMRSLLDNAYVPDVSITPTKNPVGSN